MNTNSMKLDRILRSTMAPAVAGAALLLTQAPGALAQRIIDLGAPTAPTAPAAPGAPGVSGSFHGSYTVENDGNEVQVESDGKTAQVKLNGTVITTLDLTGDWTRYEVQDAKGEVVATVLRPNRSSQVLSIFSGKAPPGARAFAHSQFPGLGSWSVDPQELEMLKMMRGNAFGVAPRAEQPKVMIGVYLESMDEDASAKTGLDPEKVTEISGVVDGGPAAKAGLQSGDVITSVDGSANGDLATIRDALKSKNPGDTLGLTVLRDGQPKQVQLTLDAYDSGLFGGQTWTWSGTPSPPPTPGEIAEVQAKLSALTTKLAALSADLKQASGAEADRIREQINGISMKIAELTAQLSQNGSAGFGNNIIIQRSGTPSATNESMQMQLDDLTQRLDDKLADIDKRLDEMNARIDQKLNELVDQLLKRMKERADNPQ